MPKVKTPPPVPDRAAAEEAKRLRLQDASIQRGNRGRMSTALTSLLGKVIEPATASKKLLGG